MKKAKIIATIGPASESLVQLENLIEAGMDVARLNFAHGNHDRYRKIIEKIRYLSNRKQRPVAILQDISGIKIRTGPLDDHHPVSLTKGQRITITTEPIMGSNKLISTNYSHLPLDLKAGAPLLLSDGLIELRVIEIVGSTVHCKVIIGGTLSEYQGINLPGIRLSAPPLTQKDIADIEFGIEQEIDFIALSFVQQAQDVLTLQTELDKHGAEIPIISKLENPSSIENLTDILEVSDGVMIARGDLGVEINPEKVPLMQKKVISAANKAGKTVITATQMLDSMIRNPRPTRAEASDVANAVIDGTDAVMLSGETAVGAYPERAVEMMHRIVTEAESLELIADYRDTAGKGRLSFPEAICNSAYHAAKTVGARYLVTFTQSGSTARLISKFRPEAEIIGISPHPKILKRLALYWGVTPMIMELIDNVDELILATEKLLLENNMVESGDKLVLLTGAPIVQKGHTSLMKLHQIRS